MSLPELIVKYRSDIDYKHDNRPRGYTETLERGFLRELMGLDGFNYGPEQMREASETMFHNLKERQPKYEVCLWAMRRAIIEGIDDDVLRTGAFELIKKINYATYERSFLPEDEFEAKTRELKAFADICLLYWSETQVDNILNAVKEQTIIVSDDVRSLSTIYPVPDSLDGMSHEEKVNSIVNWDVSENHGRNMWILDSTVENIEKYLKQQ